MASADVSLQNKRPDEQTNSRLVTKSTLGALLVFLALIPVAQILTTDNLNFWLHQILITFMWVALASSWNILGGYAGYISLGHNVFYAIGGYLGAILLLHYGVPIFAAAPLAGLLAMIVGLGVGFITLRVRGPAFIISTIALLLLLRITLENWDFVGGAGGLSLPLFDLPAEHVKIPFYYGMMLAAIGAVLLSYYVRHSKFGLGLRAISQDEIKAEAAGIPTSVYKILAYAVSGFFIGFAGALWSQYTTFISPGTLLVIRIGAQMVLMTLLGGKGTVAGPVIGAVLIISADEFSASQFGSSELNIIGTGILLIIVLLFFPDGIVGSLRKARRLPTILDWD